MKYSINAAISPHAAAALMISDEIDLSSSWAASTSEIVLTQLLKLQISEILSIVDNQEHEESADIKDIPQFGSIEMLIRVPYYFIQTGQSVVDYPQLGFFLKNDIDASLEANTKFGENHGKGAAILGLVNCKGTRFVPSSVTNSFCTRTEAQQAEIIKRLCFRIPIVQLIISNAKSGMVNGYYPMREYSESTRHRRGQCLRAIFKAMREYNNDELNYRLDNIIWED